MKKNAGIKSKEELRQRLESGETGLSIYDLELFYDESKIFKGESPYLLIKRHNDEKIALKAYWEEFAEVTKQVSWKDEVSPETPVLCWVSDETKESGRAALVIAIEAFHTPYLTDHCTYWKYATPIKPSECWGGDEE